MNRAQRRSNERIRKAMGIELARMEKPEAYQQGYLDGGKDMTKACYAAFASGMVDLGHSPEMICQILREIEERLFWYAGEDEKQRAAWTDAGLVIDFSEPFTDDKIRLGFVREDDI